MVKPSIRQPRDALLTVELVDSDGQRVPLPPGGYAIVPGNEEPFPVGDDGLIYVAGLDETGKVVIRYRQQQCALQLTLPPHPPANTTPELGAFLCEGVNT